ncbi:GOLPH3/VPS74 family protein [Rhodococcus chondri]|uniref:GPP34 family phosphoprotein n=1 Tax=Rhodococcus chondri TaxID=3065941 RepID=A0ABU7JT80_9NOCA|nr:GPP34 family phosphoprotein [Rhodococcus sp. CC-R104]MEE2033231.1 GPP34 family phosphoprotein [Rhodococcus sp. CC-R104]
MALLAEDLMLLLLDDDSGRALVDSTKLPRVLAGAVLLELTLDAVVGLDTEGSRVRKGRLVVRTATVPSDPLLAHAVRRLTDAKPMKPESAVEKLSKGIRETLLGRVVEHGWIREERGRVLGIFPTKRWPAVDDSHERQVRAELRSVLVDGSTPTARAAALVSLLSAVDAVPKIMPDVDKRQIKKRAEEIAEGDWAGKAVRKAVDAVNTAVMVAVTVPVIASN